MVNRVRTSTKGDQLFLQNEEITALPMRRQIYFILVHNSKNFYWCLLFFFYLEWSQRQVSQVESIAHEQNTQRISNLLQEKASVIS
jgi:hypothetical protein